MAEREERICIPFTHTYDQFTTFFYDGRVYLSDTSYPIGQCCVDIANMDEEVLREIDRRVEKFVPAAWALLSKKTNSAVSSAQKKMNAVWDIIFTMPVYRDLNMATELSYHTLERLYAQKDKWAQVQKAHSEGREMYERMIDDMKRFANRVRTLRLQLRIMTEKYFEPLERRNSTAYGTAYSYFYADMLRTGALLFGEDFDQMAGALVSGMMPYVGIPIGYGLIFMGIVKDNMCANGLTVTVQQVYSVNWMLMLTFIPGIIYIWFRYRKPREYKNVDVDLSAYNAVESTKLELRHWISIIAVLVVTAVEFKTQSLAVAALAGLVIMFFSGAVKWKDIEERFNDGIRMMGSIAFIMLVAGGFGMVMRATGGVNALVERSASALSSSHLLAATVITLIGLVVTMGIGTSFGTIPVIAVLFVPLCTKLGFSPAATILMISSAAALGDAGSPASDATLGPTCGLNADGQHDHIWDTCVPTFGALNIPLMIGTIIIAQFI